MHTEKVKFVINPPDVIACPSDACLVNASLNHLWTLASCVRIVDGALILEWSRGGVLVLETCIASSWRQVYGPDGQYRMRRAVVRLTLCMPRRKIVKFSCLVPLALVELVILIG